MSEPLVLVDVTDGVARITLNRPDARNAIDMDLAQALRNAVIGVERRDDVRAVVLAGNGPMFCPGGDLTWMQSQTDPEHGLHELAGALHQSTIPLSRLDAPVIAAVQGVAAGAGLSFVAAADLVVAAESAKFTMAYTAAGLSPDGGSTWYLPRIVGTRRTAELAFTNRRLSAAEAADWGLVTRVVPDEDLADEVAALAAQVAAGPTRAFGRTRRLLADTMTTGLEDHVAREADAIARCGGEPDGREGVAAFLDKRAPAYTGRPD